MEWSGKEDIDGHAIHDNNGQQPAGEEDVRWMKGYNLLLITRTSVFSGGGFQPSPRYLCARLAMI